MAEKGLNRATLIVLLVVAAAMVLIGWFVWSYKSQKPVPTSPRATSQLVVPKSPMAVREL